MEENSKCYEPHWIYIFSELCVSSTVCYATDGASLSMLQNILTQQQLYVLLHNSQHYYPGRQQHIPFRFLPFLYIKSSILFNNVYLLYVIYRIVGVFI